MSIHPASGDGQLSRLPLNCKFSIENLAEIKSLPFKFIRGNTKTSFSLITQRLEPEYSSYNEGKYLSYGTYLFIADKIRVREKDYYVAVLHGKSFYISCTDVILENPENLDVLLAAPQKVKDAFFDFTKELSRYNYLSDMSKNLKKFIEVAERGLIVTNACPYDESEYTDGTGMNFSIQNTSKKTIKYITFNFTGYNAVDDPVSSGGVRNLTRKGIGPIEPFETASYSYEYVWFTDIVEYAKVRSIVVQYTDGTAKTFTGNAAKTIPDEVANAVNYKSPVEDFLPKFENE